MIDLAFVQPVAVCCAPLIHALRDEIASRSPASPSHATYRCSGRDHHARIALRDGRAPRQPGNLPADGRPARCGVERRPRRARRVGPGGALRTWCGAHDARRRDAAEPPARRGSDTRGVRRCISRAASLAIHSLTHGARRDPILPHPSVYREDRAGFVPAGTFFVRGERGTGRHAGRLAARRAAVRWPTPLPPGLHCHLAGGAHHTSERRIMLWLSGGYQFLSSPLLSSPAAQRAPPQRGARGSRLVVSVNAHAARPPFRGGMEARLARAAAGAGPGVRQRAARRRGPARVAASGRGTEPAEAEGDRWAGAAADAEQRAFARLGGAVRPALAPAGLAPGRAVHGTREPRRAGAPAASARPAAGARRGGARRGVRRL